MRGGMSRGSSGIFSRSTSCERVECELLGSDDFQEFDIEY